MATRSPRKVVQAVTGKEFEADLKLLKQRLRAMFKLQAHVLEYPDTPAANGVVYKKKDVNKLKSDLLKSMDQLTSLYKAGLKKKGPKRPVNLNSGIRKPIRFDAVMKQFVDNADFGNYRTAVETTDAEGKKVYVAQDSGQNLKANLQVLATQSIANPTALNALFNIYIAKNGLADPNNGLVFRADPLMNQVFANTFAELTAKTQKELRDSGHTDGEFKGGYIKSGAPRARYAMKEVVGPDGKKMKVEDTSRPIYNNYYHVFNPAAISRSYINSIISAHKVDPAQDAALFKLTENEQNAYRAAITQAVTTGASTDFNAIAAQAIASLPSLDAAGRQRLQLRGRTDTEDVLARATTKSYSLTKPKK